MTLTLDLPKSPPAMDTKPSLAGLEDLLTLIVGAAAIVLVTAWATVAAIGEEMPEPEFRRLVDRSELLATLPPPNNPPSEFDELVIQALDELPPEFQAAIERVPVVVSDRGTEFGAYGHYMGGTVANDGFPDRIVASPTARSLTRAMPCSTMSTRSPGTTWASNAVCRPVISHRNLPAASNSATRPLRRAWLYCSTISV